MRLRNDTLSTLTNSEIDIMKALLEPEAFEELEKTLADIRKSSASGSAIIVEGEKDEKALRELDVSGPIHQIPTEGKTSLNSLEDLKYYSEAIILTDFDRTGEELAEFCNIHLKKIGINVLSDLRNKLRNFVRKAVKDIEGIASFMRTERASQSRYNRNSYQRHSYVFNTKSE